MPTPAVIDKVRSSEHESDRVPHETLDKLQPLHGKSFQTMEAFRGALGAELPADEARKYRAALREAARDEKAASLGYLAMMFGAITALAGMLATLTGGYLGDFLRRRGWHGSYFLISGLGMFIALPLFLLSLVAPLPFGWVVIFFGVFFNFFNTGPTNTVLANVTPPALCASAFALNIFIIHCLRRRVFAGDRRMDRRHSQLACRARLPGGPDRTGGTVLAVGRPLLGARHRTRHRRSWRQVRSRNSSIRSVTSSPASSSR